MQNRRKDPFRYVLKEPIAFEMWIISLNGAAAPEKPIRAELRDVSRSGCRISMPLGIPVDKNEIRIGLNIVLNVDMLRLEGTLRWNRREEDGYDYGVQLHIAPEYKEVLSREMRELAGADRIRVM
ncbi:PilZ domain-containing protein [Saccharibacillus alkalitolerans]|uniref:PilZ domain-containing protein n=1 Tax=Saccharibacillus alkalitolerans TaxID=2705290 RepID=A0ABX0FAU2_9BACL|nr:PilZ domain-containing protein [Saccharibacillus alkalitolerans]NGZ77079.1 PilZ domain-containing protein [Saccharibacillus alkalitolerans]